MLLLDMLDRQSLVESHDPFEVRTRLDEWLLEPVEEERIDPETRAVMHAVGLRGR